MFSGGLRRFHEPGRMSYDWPKTRFRVRVVSLFEDFALLTAKVLVTATNRISSDL